MKILGRQLRLPWVKNVGETTTLADPAEWLIRTLFAQMTAAGVKVTPLTAMGISTVFACVNVKSRSMSVLPIKLMRKLEGGGFLPATEHYLYDLIKTSPNEDMTAASFVKAIQANACLRKAGYGLINRNGLIAANGEREIAEIIPIPFWDIDEECDKQWGLRYRIHSLNKYVTQKDLIVIPGLTFNGVCGLDMLTMARECIGLAIALQDNAARFFGNGSRPGGTLEHPNTLSQEAQDRLREQVEAKIKGSKNAWNLLILEEGLKYTAQRSDNDSSQFNESRIAQDKAIARFFQIPQSKIGILNEAHYNNVEQANIDYVTDSILPDATQWEQELDRKLLSKEERKRYTFKVNMEALLRGDAASRFAAYATGRQWGWLNVDEIREKENMNPLPNGEGQTYLQPSNMIDAGDSAAAKLTQSRSTRKPTPTPNEDQE